MDIQLTPPVKPAAADFQTVLTALETPQPMALPSLLSDSSVTVEEEDEDYVDLESLAAKLTLESEDARENSVMDIFTNAYETVSRVSAAAAEQDAEILNKLSEEMKNADSLGDRLADIHEQLEAAEVTLQNAEAAYQQATEALDAFVEDPADPESVAEKARLESVQAEAAAAKEAAAATVADLDAQFAAVDADLTQVNDTIDRLYNEMSDVSYHALIDTATVMLEDYDHMMSPLIESDEEHPVDSKKPITEMTIGELIQFLREREAEFLDDVEARREQTV